MALAPGETSETFIREVDEKMRRDQAEAVFKRYGRWFAVGALLLLAAVAAWLFWQGRQRDQAAADSETFAAVLGDIGQPGKPSVAPRLDTLAGEADGPISGAARLTRAAVAIQDGDRNTAIAQYRKLIDDKGAPPTYRDAATIRLTQLEFDSMKPADVIARLQPLAVKDNAWFGSAGEMTAIAMIKAGRKPEASALLSAIAADKTVPDSLRARAEQLAAGLAIPAAPAAAR